METSVYLDEIKGDYWYVSIKSFFDILISLVGCLVLLVFVVFIKIVSLLNKDTESIFYTQDRIGKNGKTFKLYKFRSMVSNSDNMLESILDKNPELKEEYELNKKLSNDPRVTKLGRFLRKTSIDELPQLLNVLKGDMSIIGNRPYMIKEKCDMGDFYDIIIKTRPGLSGLWQVNGRSNTTFSKRLEMEEWYSLNCSLSLDIKLFVKTFCVVLLNDDAK